MFSLTQYILCLKQTSHLLASLRTAVPKWLQLFKNTGLFERTKTEVESCFDLWIQWIHLRFYDRDAPEIDTMVGLSFSGEG